MRGPRHYVDLVTISVLLVTVAVLLVRLSGHDFAVQNAIAISALRGDKQSQEPRASIRNHQAGWLALLLEQRRDGIMPTRGSMARDRAPLAETEPR